MGQVALEPAPAAPPRGDTDDVPSPCAKATHALVSDAQRASLALDAGKMGTWAWDIVSDCVTGDPFVAALFGLEDVPQPWPVEMVFGQMHPDDEPLVRPEVDRALNEDADYQVEFRTVRPGDTETLWLGARGRVVERAEDGTPLVMMGVNWDATEKRRHEERLALLAGEMDHRVKNSFAVIRALIKMGERTATDVHGLARTLRVQVQAMADAHAISARLARQTSAPEGSVPIGEVITSALKPWIDARPPRGARVNVTAADEVYLAPQRVSPVAMLLYELATNAAKYGPLGERGGTLDVEARHQDDALVLSWRETCPVLPTSGQDVPWGAQTEGSGFGSVLIRHCVSSLRARVESDLTAEGLRFSLTIPRDV